MCVALQQNRCNCVALQIKKNPITSGDGLGLSQLFSYFSGRAKPHYEFPGPLPDVQYMYLSL